MSINPQQYFNLISTNYPLLHDIYRKSEYGMNNSDLVELIKLHRSTLESPQSMIDKLLDLKIIEPLADATANYEMTRTLSVLFRFILQEQRLTSTATIQSYLDEIERTLVELDKAVADSKTGMVERSLNEMKEVMERIRQDSKGNRESIINEVMAAKSNKDKKTVSERYEKIAYLFDNYIDPLQDLTDLHKSMDGLLDTVETTLQAGVERYYLDGVMHREFSGCSARLVRLRNNIRTDFRESLREILPLYTSLKKDNNISIGVSRILEKVQKDGVKSLEFPERLAIQNITLREGLFNDTDVEAYLHGVRGYEPKEPPTINFGNNEQSAPTYIPPDELFRTLQGVQPVVDVFQWLIDRYMDYPLVELLRAYGRIYDCAIFTPVFSKESKTYKFSGIAISCYVMEVK